jgi:hypothetical protein
MHIHIKLVCWVLTYALSHREQVPPDTIHNLYNEPSEPGSSGNTSGKYDLARIYTASRQRHRRVPVRGGPTNDSTRGKGECSSEPGGLPQPKPFKEGHPSLMAN